MRTQSRLADLQSVLETLAARLAEHRERTCGRRRRRGARAASEIGGPRPVCQLHVAWHRGARPRSRRATPRPTQTADERRRSVVSTRQRRGPPDRARRGRPAARARSSRSRTDDRPQDQFRSHSPHRRRAPRRAGGAGGNQRRTQQRQREDLDRFRAGAVRRARRPNCKGALRQSQAHRIARRRHRDRGDARRTNGRCASPISAALGIGWASLQNRQGRRAEGQATERRRGQIGGEGLMSPRPPRLPSRQPSRTPLRLRRRAGLP